MAQFSRAHSRTLVFLLFVTVVVCALGAGAGVARADDPGHITGTIANGNGQPFTYVYVIAHRMTAEGYWYWETSTTPSETGAYDLTVQPGTYKVEFTDYVGWHATEYYDNAGLLEDGLPLEVAAGQTVSDIDAELADWGHVTGTVTGADGLPVVGVGVYPYLVTSSGVATWPSASAVATDADGRYDLGGLYAGKYRIEFTPPTDSPWAQEAWNGADTVATGADVTVSFDTPATGVDAVLDAGGSVSGLVTDPEGVDLLRRLAEARQARPPKRSS